MALTDRHPETDPAAEPVRRAGMPAGRVIALLLTSLVLASLLGAESLERVAERQGYGRGRDLLLDVAHPLASVSHALWLDRPRRWLASITGHEDGPTSDAFGASLPTTSTTTTSTTATTAPPTTPPATAPVTSTTVPPPPPTTLPPRRVPTPEAPLRLWMGGDSLMGTISEQTVAALGGDPRVAPVTDVQVGTGLARPDVLDWAAELTARMQSDNPDVVVLSFGANDDQPLHPPDGSFARLFTPEWQTEYARRVGIMMDIASAGDSRTVVWLGLPQERPEQLDQVKDQMNAAARAEAAKRPGVVFVDLAPTLAGPDGGYSDDVTRPDGSVVRARTADGVHLSVQGAALVAPLVLDAFAGGWHLR